MGQLYCLKGRSVHPLGFVLLACSNSLRCCVLLAPCCLRGRRVWGLLMWPGNRGAVVFVALCLQLVWMTAKLWRWLGKGRCYQLLYWGIRTCCIPVGWIAWLCHLIMVPLILVLCIVSLHHIVLMNFGMAHAVVCLLCVEMVSKLFARSLALIDGPGACCSPNPMLSQCTVFCLPVQLHVSLLLDLPK